MLRIKIALAAAILQSSAICYSLLLHIRDQSTTLPSHHLQNSSGTPALALFRRFLRQSAHRPTEYRPALLRLLVDALQTGAPPTGDADVTSSFLSSWRRRPVIISDLSLRSRLKTLNLVDAMNIGSSSVRIQSLQTALYPVGIDKIQLRYATTITCGLRKSSRTRRRSDGVLSTEAIQAVQSLKLAARNPSKLDQVFDSKLTRLLKDDLLDAFVELQRQQHLDIALKVFEFMRKEAWYEPDQSLYGDLMLMFGKKKLIIKVENIFSKLIKEGLKPDTRVYTELIGAYLKVDMIDKAMEAYKLMKSSGCVPDELTLTIMIRNFESVGRDDLAEIIKIDCAQYLDSPNKFLKQVTRKYPKRLRLNMV